MMDEEIIIINDGVENNEQVPVWQPAYPTITRSIYLSIRFLFYSTVIGFIIGTVTTPFRYQNPIIKGLLMLISYCLAICVTIWVALGKSKKNEGKPLKFKFNRFPLLPVLLAAFMVLTMPVLVDPVNVLLPIPEYFKKIFADMSNFNIFSIANIVIAAPILEEILFRGIILDGLLKNYSPRKAIVVSAIIFAVIHLNPWQATAAFLIGLLIGWMYWKTNSIIPGMIIHLVNNSFAISFGLIFKNVDTIKQLMPTPMYITLVLGCVTLITCCCILLERYFKNNAPRPVEESEYLIAEEGGHSAK